MSSEAPAAESGRFRGVSVVLVTLLGWAAEARSEQLLQPVLGCVTRTVGYLAREMRTVKPSFATPGALHPATFCL